MPPVNRYWTKSDPRKPRRPRPYCDLKLLIAPDMVLRPQIARRATPIPEQSGAVADSRSQLKDAPATIIIAGSQRSSPSA